ncbi:hypothetical protein Cni_G05901 [Canna indica]|uniref:Uncharacterized protein n=1 Tax=Canna indica TaxID=4628 RepID=A0AAQ3Q488_9LILI|nr:hypothetical protein Cni_G05901 [Canna indica]
MGNCMKKSAQWKLEEEGGGRNSAAAEEDSGGVVEKEGGCKVKILLTRKELEWLVLHLKEKREQRLEDVLEEMGKLEIRSRKAGKGWKPSLESIVESPDHVLV